ncbi:MAG: sorbosone dehydrogenase family protein [Isosphaeraceae bacterium]|jgi:glucose/arabinose dehydrogenase
MSKQVRAAILAFGVTLLGALGSESVAMADGDGARPADVTLKGKDALGDWTTDAPGVRRKITVADLATPYDTPSANNHPRVVERPQGAWPKAPEGFAVTQFADGLIEPRVIVRAPNGDLFVAESRASRLRVFRDADGDGKPEVNEVFTTRLDRPFGIAFFPPGPEPKFLYVGNTGSVVRFAYRNGDSKARGRPQMIVKNIPTGREEVGGGGHWTRDLQFSADGKTLYVSVGSRSNVSDDASEKRRAVILAFDPDGKNERTFASGIRNPVGLAVHPRTGQLWTSANERDGLGDNLVPDYITHVEEGGFYGWPWYYLGPNQDPRHKGKHPELKDKVIVPDVLVQSHSASLDLTFYDGSQFPQEYRLDAFSAEHGSWNRARRTGYKVIRVPMKDGKATGEYEDFLIGFVTKEGDVWGRPVGVAVAADGSLLVTDDGSGSVWRVAYTGKK